MECSNFYSGDDVTLLIPTKIIQMIGLIMKKHLEMFIINIIEYLENGAKKYDTYLGF